METIYYDLLDQIDKDNAEGIEKILKNNKIDITTAPDYKATPLHYAARKGAVNAIDSFLKYGADINMKQGGMTMLMEAALAGSKKCEKAMKFLLENGADVNAHNDHKASALHYAVQNKNTEMVKLLLKYNIDTEIGKEDKGFGVEGKALYTALHTAIMRNYLEIASLLLDAGADPNIAPEKQGSNWSQNLLGLIVRRKLKKGVELLYKYGADTSVEFLGEKLKKDADNLYHADHICTSLEDISSSPKTITCLDLRAQDLKQIPKEVLQLENLQAIYLGDNAFKSIDLDLSQLKNLKIVSLKGALLKNIEPNLFQDLPLLQFVDLRGNTVNGKNIKNLSFNATSVHVISNDLDFDQHMEAFKMLENEIMGLN